MKRGFINVLVFLFLLSLEGCFLFPDPKETLPPATQTGANTFGCLVNGTVWLPKGFNGTTNLSPSYDPNFNGKPILNITSYRIVSDTETQEIALGINGIYKIGTYTVMKDTLAFVSFNIKKCNYFYFDSLVYRKGSIVITKLDLPIISGTFDFILYKPGCDTLKITNGRFDIKL